MELAFDFRAVKAIDEYKKENEKWATFIFCDVHRDGTMNVWPYKFLADHYKNDFEIGLPFLADEFIPEIVKGRDTDIVETIGERIA